MTPSSPAPSGPLTMDKGGDFVWVPREPTEEMLKASPVVGTGPDENGKWAVNTKPALAVWRAMLSASPQAPETGWQPIETAPLGKGALLWFPDLPTNEVQIGTWRAWDQPWCGLSGEWVAKDTGDAFATVGDGQIWPTHWQPLPAPPLAVRENETVSVAGLPSSQEGSDTHDICQAGKED